MVVCVTLGTGIGGGLVIDGRRVYRGAFGIACEYGHMTLVPDGRRCACGNQGCWEMYASGRALARDARELAAESPVAAARLLELAGLGRGHHRPVVTAAAAGRRPGRAVDLHDDGPLARARPGQSRRRRSTRRCSSSAAGVSAAGELLLRPAREEFAHTLTGRGFRPVAAHRVRPLGPDAGLVGAADLARRLTSGATTAQSAAQRCRSAGSRDRCRPCACCPYDVRSMPTTAPRSRG